MLAWYRSAYIFNLMDLFEFKKRHSCSTYERLLLFEQVIINLYLTSCSQQTNACSKSEIKTE